MDNKASLNKFEYIHIFLGKEVIEHMFRDLKNGPHLK